jgi:hypothetical protein
MDIENIDNFIFFQKRFPNKRILLITKIVLNDYIFNYFDYQSLIITNSKEIQLALDCREKVKNCLNNDIFEFINKFTQCALLLSNYSNETLQNLLSYILKIDNRLLVYQEIHEIASLLFKKNKCFICNKDIITYHNETKKSFDLHCINSQYYSLIPKVWITVCHSCHLTNYHNNEENKSQTEEQNIESINFKGIIKKNNENSTDFIRKIVSVI